MESQDVKQIEYKKIFVNRNSRNIFFDFSLSFARKEKILISGKSGTGKTTLFKLLLGFEQPDKGCVNFFGNPVDKEHIQQIRRQIFYLSQDIDLKNLRISQLLDEVLSANGCQAKKSQGLIDTLSFLDLNPGVLTQEVNKLSGGERQRIGLLICFLLDRPVWLLDEPTSALDDQMKKKIARHILAQNKTIIIISHDEEWNNDKRIKIERLT